MANEHDDLKTVIRILDAHQDIIDDLATALSRVRAGEALLPQQEPSNILSRGKHFRMTINEMKIRLGII
jgi:hypothetical protein